VDSFIDPNKFDQEDQAMKRPNLHTLNQSADIIEIKANQQSSDMLRIRPVTTGGFGLQKT
jgi:dihydropteroate synthase